MKILLVHNRYAQRGGEDRAVDLLIDALGRRGNGVRLFERDNRDLKEAGAATKAFRLLQMPFAVDTYVDLRKDIRSFRPDIVHVHNVFPWLSPSVYTAVRSTGAPAVQTLHNFRFSCLNGLFLLPDGTVCERCHHGSFLNGVRFGCHSDSRPVSAAYAVSLGLQRSRRVWERALDLCLAPAPFVGRKLAETGFPADRIRTVPPFLPGDVVPSARARRHVLFVGRLSREKGVSMLLDAWKGIETPLVVVGDGEERSSLEARASAAGLANVRFLGAQPPARVLELMEEAWLLAVPSKWYENFPFVLLEAWSRGTPVLVPRYGSFPDLVEEGKNGFFFTAFDADALAATLRRLLSAPEALEALRSGVHAAFRQRHSEEAAIERLMEAYADARARKGMSAAK